LLTAYVVDPVNDDRCPTARTDELCPRLRYLLAQTGLKARQIARCALAPQTSVFERQGQVVQE
jgi:hypothetical protein